MAVLAVLLYCPTVGAGQGESAVLPVYCQIRQTMLYEAVRWAALEMAAAEPDGQEARVAAVTNWLSIHGLDPSLDRRRCVARMMQHWSSWAVLSCATRCGWRGACDIFVSYVLYYAVQWAVLCLCCIGQYSGLALSRAHCRTIQQYSQYSHTAIHHNTVYSAIQSTSASSPAACQPPRPTTRSSM